MLKWQNILFVVVCATVLVVLLNAPPETTPKTPFDKTHENPKVYDGCSTCHIPGGEGPEVRDDHVNSKGELLGSHVKCYMCHKPHEAPAPKM